jgi:hypothetical protein
MRHKFKLILFLTFFSIECHSQSDYRNGYIIDISNDTIFGLIDYRGSILNSKECSFKIDINSQPIIYKPFEIIGYRFIDSKYYISYKITFGDSIKEVFLEYLLKGIVNVYYYHDLNEDRFFMDKNNGEFSELKNTNRIMTINNTQYIQDRNEYRGILTYFFYNSPKILKQIEKLPFDRKSFIDISKTYHNEVCTSEKCTIYEKKISLITNVSFGPLISLNYFTNFLNKSSLSNDYYYLKLSDFRNVLSPSFGIFLKFCIPYLSERLSLKCEEIYSRYSLKSNNYYIDHYFKMNYVIDESLTQDLLKSSLILRYEFPIRKIKPVLQIGGFINNFTKTTFTSKLNILSPSGISYYKNKINANPFSNYSGFCIGTGLILKAYSNIDILIDLKYEWGFGMFQNSITNNIILNLGFSIL